MKQDKTLSLIGLAQKGGHVVSGEYQTEQAVKQGKAALVILAEDVSDNTKKKFQNMCEGRGVTSCSYGSKTQLGHCLGKEFRASLAVTEEGLAKAILKQMK